MRRKPKKSKRIVNNDLAGGFYGDFGKQRKGNMRGFKKLSATRADSAVGTPKRENR